MGNSSNGVEEQDRVVAARDRIAATQAHSLGELVTQLAENAWQRGEVSNAEHALLIEKLVPICEAFSSVWIQASRAGYKQGHRDGMNDNPWVQEVREMLGEHSPV